MDDSARQSHGFPARSVRCAGPYLPKEKILFNADLYSPPAQGAQPAPPTPGMRTLDQNIRRLKLDVAQHVPAHGRVGTQEEFARIVTGPGQTKSPEVR